MLGAIAGDIIGSVHEHIGTKSTDFDLFVPESTFTDDTVLAVAVADCLLNGLDYVDTFHEQGETKSRLKDALEQMFGYDLGNSIEALRPTYLFDESCQGTVPAALIAFLESESPSGFEDGAACFASPCFRARRPEGARRSRHDGVPQLVRTTPDSGGA